MVQTRQKYLAVQLELEAALGGDNPDRPHLLFMIARNYELLGEWSAATRYYKEALVATVVDWQYTEITNGLRRVRRKRIATILPF